MSDLISRQAAIDKIFEVYEYEFPTASGTFDEFATVIIPNLLINLPSAQRTGRWIYYPEINAYSCSECKHYVYRYEPYNYCPYCGADMRGEQDG